MNNKNTVWAVAGLVIIGAIVYAIWTAVIKSSMQPGTNNNDGIVCTAEAMQCPDGSWVGRSGPSCQFICPVSSSTNTGPVTIEAKLNQKVVPIAESITVLEITEDSRCPQDVQCIQAGTVRIRIRIESGMGVATETIALNGTITTETEEMTFIAVRPEKISTQNITNGMYTFIFKVSKR